jgi:murein DD-endopeptidase MepM/ murein hydrolase activator NlpD
LEYRPVAGELVVAVTDGRVRFSGMVAGVRYVVVEQSDGRVATYGYLVSSAVSAGAQLRRGQIVGYAAGRLYFGLRQDGEYIDPLPFLGRWRVRPRLVPTDGSPWRRAPPVLMCATSGDRR